MNQFGGYSVVKVGNISPTKLRKALDGHAVRLSANELSGDRVMVVSKLNEKAINKAKLKGKGLTTYFTTGEMAKDLEYHDNAGGNLNGGSLWSWIRNTAVPWVKRNWSVIKPVVSKLADSVIPAAATALGQPALAVPVREGVRQLTGVGMKEKMAKVRAARKVKGGSFRAP